MSKVILFYKKLIQAGGAERLLLEVYNSLKMSGYQVNIVSYDICEEALFGINVDKNDLINLKTQNNLTSLLYLRKYLLKNQNSIIICDSGHIDIYLATLLTNISYSLHIHHPLFMTLNDLDKYSIFLKKYFEKRIINNFASHEFKKIKNSLSLKSKILLNLRAFFSIAAIKHSKNNFVLSSYAKDEKKELYGVDSEIVCGAVSSSVFEYIPDQSMFDKDSKFEYKILYIGRLHIHKRIDILIQAFKLIIEKKINAKLFIGGTGSEQRKLIELIQYYNLEEYVELLGFIPNEKLFDYYSSADLFVSLDWADYNITTYEALAMGTKVLVASEAEHNDKELLESNLLYISKADADNVSVMIQKALVSEIKISKELLKEYLHKFTWDEYSLDLINIIKGNKNA